MKEMYISNLKDLSSGSSVILLGWVKGKRRHGNVAFLDVVDSTGSIQVVVHKPSIGEAAFDVFKKANYEAAVEITGTLENGSGKTEINAKTIKVISDAAKQFSPRPRSDFDIFDPSLTDHLLRNRHAYIRNPKIMAILRFRHILIVNP